MSQTNVKDLKSLEDLGTILHYSADCILKLLGAIDQYFRNVMQSLKEQLNVVKEKLEEAENELKEAQDELRECENSREYDEDAGEYVPSCNWEAMRVNQCQKVYDDWKEKYDQAQSIIEQCEAELDTYHHPGGIFVPPGGERRMERMADENMQAGYEKMQQIVEKVKYHADFNMSDVADDGKTIITIDDRDEKEEDRMNRYNNAVENIKIEQLEEANRKGVSDADVAMVCPKCHRPFLVCVCGENI